MIRTVAMTEIHLRFSPIRPRAGSKLVTASADGSARVYNTITGACLAILTGHAGEISKIQFNPQVRTTCSAPPWHLSLRIEEDRQSSVNPEF